MNYIEIDKSHCKACYLCVDVCPKKLIRVSEETNSLGQFTVGFLDPKGECIGCAVCAMRCPHLAITEVVKEK